MRLFFRKKLYTTYCITLSLQFEKNYKNLYSPSYYGYITLHDLSIGY